MSTENTQLGFNARGLTLLLAFVAAGFLLSVAIVEFASNAGSLGIPLVVGIILIVPPAIALSIVGLKQGYGYLADFWASWNLGNTLIFLLFISTLVFRVRESAEVTSTPIDAWSLLRLGPEAVVAVLLLRELLRRGTPWLRSLFRGLFGALAAYGLACALSSTWSVYASWTLYKSLEFLLDLSVFALILARIDTVAVFRKMLNWVWALYALELVWTWMGAAIWRSQALDDLGRLSGVWPVVASNSVGVSAAIICLVSLARFLSPKELNVDRSWYALLFCFGTISLVASQTRNSLAGLAVGILILLLYQRRIWTLLVSAGVSIVVLFSGPGHIRWSGSPVDIMMSIVKASRLWDFIARSQTEAQIEDLSSRTIWWSYAWQQFVQHPLTGLGAYAAGKFAVLSKLGVGQASQMHSDWVEVIAGTSFWGLIPFLIAFFGCWWILLRTYRDRSLTPDERQLSGEILGILGIITVRSFFNVEMIWHAPFLYFAVVAYAEFLRRKRKERRLGLNRPFSESPSQTLP